MMDNEKLNYLKNLRTSATTSTGNSYIGDINPWNGITRDTDPANYGYINDTYSVNRDRDRDLLISKIDELEKRIDKLTELLESVVG